MRVGARGSEATTAGWGGRGGGARDCCPGQFSSTRPSRRGWVGHEAALCLGWVGHEAAVCLGWVGHEAAGAVILTSSREKRGRGRAE